MTIAIALGASIAALILTAVALLAALGRRFRRRLSDHPSFTPPEGEATWSGTIHYASPSDPLLRTFREGHRLDAVAGDGSELERVVRLMAWAHGLTTHARNPSWPKRMNGLHLAELARDHKKRFNCWMYATVLNDVLLSLGFASRIVHLWPHKEQPNESHVVNAVYSQTFGKWIHLDPDMNAYVTDETGTPLDVIEIRERIVRRQPLRVSDSVDLAFASFLGKRLLKRLYIWYLSKNIFRIDCRARSEPDYETESSGRIYLQLIPDGYHDAWLNEPRRTERGNTIHYLRDPEAFWGPPEPS